MRVLALVSCGVALWTGGEVVLALMSMHGMGQMAIAQAQSRPDQSIPFYQDYQGHSGVEQEAELSDLSDLSELSEPALTQPIATDSVPSTEPAQSEPAIVPFGTMPPTQSDTAENPAGTNSSMPSGLPPSELPLADFPSTNLDNPLPPPGSLPAPGLPTPVPQPAGTPVTDVIVIGATPELEQLIRQAVQTRPGQPTTLEQLQNDVSILRSSGFFQQVDVQTEELPQGWQVTYIVEPLVVRSLQVTGARELDPAIAIQALQPLIGQPINPSILQEGVDQINQWYFLNGYKLSQVEGFEATPAGDMTILVIEPIVREVNYQFVNDEGSPVDDDGDPVTGRTRDSVIQPAIQLQPGTVFNEDQALDDVERLRDLGFFEAVVVDVELDGEFADVTYNLAERLARRVNFGGGYNTDIGLFVTVNYSDRNFGGIGDQLNLGVQVSVRGVQFGTRFTSPYRESHPNRLGYSIFAGSQRRLSPVFSEEVELPNGDRVRENRIGGGFSLMRPVGEWDAELGFSYNRVSLRDEDGDLFAEDELGNELSASGTGADDLFLLSLEVTRDRRDNPENPGAGSVLTLGTEQSLPIGQGDIFLNRLQASYAYYVPLDLLGHGHQDNPEVVAFNVQAGTIIGDLPPYEAFALGGTNSVRGYREGRVGSGRSYALAAVEYRFPILDPVGGVLFADFATDLGTADDVPGNPADARDKPGDGFGAGLGLRVDSPFGLFRLDFGVNDQGDNRLHFGFGQRF